ncbi:hypothetical protein P4O66_000747 [Electrophorus voltai]|uniref:Peptidase S1 domain-containing protein n=1 Tax=Electrophorus voltai TaxID=2609070 RepID=A0AAD8ZFA7_9TELE|nr:hypothetical protein P4O66_000747 [Electrophorus voltai]
MNQVSRSVTSVTINPNYDANTLNNDLAVLQLSSTVTFTPYITPICLAASGCTFFNGTLSWVTGWGNIASGVSLPSPGYLQEVQVPIIGNRQCFCLYGGGITGNMICAGALTGGKDSCQGDSGGPIIFKQGSIWIQAGIVSFGTGCAQANYPGVYTRVSQYQNWINQVITSNQPGFVMYMSSGTNADINVTCSNLLSATNLFRLDVSFLIELLHFVLLGISIDPCTSIVNDKALFYTASQVTVYLGTETLQGTNINQVSRSVTSVTINPNYDAKTVNNDMALLQLSSTVNFTPYITPICLAASGSTFFNGTLSWVTGWGNIATGVSLPSPGYLQEVQVPIIGNRQCFCLYGGGITGNMICAGALTGNKDPCNGDSGGPLVVKQGSVWIQAGIVSFGKAQGCAQANDPGAFTRVSEYQNWINQVITSNQPGFVTYTSSGTNADLNVTCSNLPPTTSVATNLCYMSGLNKHRPTKDAWERQKEEGKEGKSMSSHSTRSEVSRGRGHPPDSRCRSRYGSRGGVRNPGGPPPAERPSLILASLQGTTGREEPAEQISGGPVQGPGSDIAEYHREQPDQEDRYSEMDSARSYDPCLDIHRGYTNYGETEECSNVYLWSERVQIVRRKLQWR